MALIEDGTGGGFRAQVDRKKRLRTHSVIETDLHAVSEDGDAYSWASGTYNPAAGAETVLLVKNTGNAPLHIEGIWLSTDIDTRVQIHIPTSEVTVTAGNAVVVGRNLNTGSSNVAEASAASDETNNTQGDIIWSAEIYAVSGPFYVDFQGAVILAKNVSIGVDYVIDVAALDVTIIGFFET